MSSLRKRTKRAKSGFTLIEVMVVVVIMGILLNIALPNMVRAREQTRVKSCIKNLKQIDAAKQQWAIDNKKTGTDTPASTDLFGTNLYIRGTQPKCPGGYTYTINNLSTEPSCALGKLFPPYYHTFTGQ
ncbi:MAG: prepilin-type N-terminal cleavage/methylation domain-containing protein [Armatimonadota bacterium]